MVVLSSPEHFLFHTSRSFKRQTLHTRRINLWFKMTLMDNLHVRLTFNLGKTNKIFYYSYKISRIAKFGGEML